MKIYISVDMEGMAGITAPYQEKEETVSFRRALHNQIRWIIDGIHQSPRNGEVESDIVISSTSPLRGSTSLPATAKWKKSLYQIPTEAAQTFRMTSSPKWTTASVWSAAFPAAST